MTPETIFWTLQAHWGAHFDIGALRGAAGPRTHLSAVPKKVNPRNSNF
jgi:hypothetical protein